MDSFVPFFPDVPHCPIGEWEFVDRHEDTFYVHPGWSDTGDDDPKTEDNQ